MHNNVKSKKSILDVRCTDHPGFQYIIEVQNKLMQSYPQRIQYYVSNTYVSQLRAADSYLELKPVILLSILNHTLFPDDISYSKPLRKESHQTLVFKRYGVCIYRDA